MIRHGPDSPPQGEKPVGCRRRFVASMVITAILLAIAAAVVLALAWAAQRGWVSAA